MIQSILYANALLELNCSNKVANMSKQFVFWKKGQPPMAQHPKITNVN